MPIMRPTSWAYAALLAAVLSVEALAVVAANAPGRANVDIVHSARQALGEIPYDDWHPPVMAALWHVLLRLTGEISSLFYLQVGGFFLASFALALAVWALAGRRRAALPMLAFPLLPYVLSQLGMLWKDTLMAVAFLAAVAALLLAAGWARERRRWRIALVATAVVMLLFATLVRKNAAFAVVPIICLAVVLAWPRLREARWWTRGAALVAAVGIFGGVTIGAGGALDARLDVRSTSQVSQIYLDDVLFSVPASEIAASSAPKELKDRLLAAQKKCRDLDEIWDAYWNCYGRGATGKNFEPIADREELRALWREEVLGNPVRYVKYRAKTYQKFLTQVGLEYWPTGWRGDAEKVGLGPAESRAEAAQTAYVEGFAADRLGWLFLPWFWLLAGVIWLLAGLAIPRLGAWRWPIVAIAASGVFYLLGYFPMIPSDHFRYTYWASLTGTLAPLLLFLALWVRPKATDANGAGGDDANGAELDGDASRARGVRASRARADRPTRAEPA